jgi:hypothetical protein
MIVPLKRTIKLGKKAMRSVLGEDSRAEKALKNRFSRDTSKDFAQESGPGWVQRAGNGWVAIGENSQFDGPRRGVALRGGCDLPSTFTSAPLMRDDIKGTVLISRDTLGGTGAHATSQLVQTLNDIPDEATREFCERLQIPNAQFKPFFWQDTVEYPLEDVYGEFPKNVVVMSAATDVVRTLYRNREHGYYVDPGGWWLNQNLGDVLGDLDVVKWFSTNFQKVGKISVDDYARNVETIVTELRDRAGAEPVIYSALAIDPGNPCHNYQLVRGAKVIRRREFHVALMDLSKRLNFPVVDVDRILKRDGVQEQIDFAHFTAEGMRSIGAEFYRVLKELEVV